MKWITDERAQTTAEYGLILSLVVVTVIITLITLGGAMSHMWTSITAAWPAG